MSRTLSLLAAGAFAFVTAAPVFAQTTTTTPPATEKKAEEKAEKKDGEEARRQGDEGREEGGRQGREGREEGAREGRREDDREEVSPTLRWVRAPDHPAPARAQ